MKLIILTGKLGSGKTTVLNNLVNSVKNKDDIEIVINEFANSGVDKHFISMSVNELNEGCVCCSKGEELKELLKKLTAKEHVFLETSGVSSLNQLLERLSDDYEEVSEVVTVIDVYKLSKSKGFSKDTITNLKLSTTILINKTDLVNLEGVDEIYNKISKINDQANIIKTNFGSIKLEDLPLKGKFLNKKESSPFWNLMYWLFPELKLDSETKHIQKEGLKSVSLNFKYVNITKFKKILKKYNIQRGKGFLKGNDGVNYKFNYASGLVYLEEYEKDIDTSVVLIGSFGFFEKRKLLKELNSI